MGGCRHKTSFIWNMGNLWNFVGWIYGEIVLDYAEYTNLRYIVEK
jgi:hypothetical protein